MDCANVLDLLQDYLDETIEQSEMLILEKHLKGCRECRKELAEMKALFWELERLDKIQVVLPPEVNSIKEELINRAVANAPGKFGVKDFINSQQEAFKGATMFLNFIPGSNLAKDSVSRGVKKAPELVYDVFSLLFKGGLKIAKTRG